VSGGGASITGTGKIMYYDTVGSVTATSADTMIMTLERGSEIVADGDKSYRADVRLFSAMTVLNGDFVPHLGFELRNLAKGDEQIIDVNGGLGLNLNIDRGFFWAGLEGLYESSTLTDNNATDWERLGGRISFGIERNVIWDWLIWRTDGIIAEDIFYTFTNLFSGNHHHLMTRISVTYSF